MNCKKCNKEFTPEPQLRNYCSLRCRNTKYHSAETKNRLSKITKEINKKKIELGHKIGVCDDSEKELIRRKKISNTMKANPNAGGLREGSGRGVKQWYNSPIAGNVYLRSTYELEYAKWLDRNNINWKQNYKKFPYEFKGDVKFYYPDFYLPDSDEYIEVKGYITEKDKCKWKFFPNKLIVLKFNDLILLGLNIK